MSVTEQHGAARSGSLDPAAAAASGLNRLRWLEWRRERRRSAWIESTTRSGRLRWACAASALRAERPWSAEWIRARLSRLPAASALTRRADAAGARRLRLRRVDERPLVVVIASVVETDRFVL